MADRCICGKTNNRSAMILQFILFVIYLSVGCWVSFKWIKCRCEILGNEIIFVIFPILPLLLLPGASAVVALRGLTHSLLFGSYVFWSNMLSKGKRDVLPVFALMWLMFAVLEIALLFAGKGDAADGGWYMLLWFIFIQAGYSPFVYKRKDSRFSKNTFSLYKVGTAMAGALLFYSISSGGVLLLFLCKSSDSVAYIIFAVAGVMPLLFMFRNMPSCMNYMEFEEMKKKAYILGRGMKDGQLMGEEHGLVNETLVEDVRIIYNLMTLFEKEKLYRNLDVKIHDVARMIGTNKSYLSRALNTRLSKNFRQFVNYYRVKELCTLYIENPKSDMRVLSEQCGFSSQSNLSIVFKYNTGHTPGDWCRMVKLKLENNESVAVDDYLL